MGCPDGGDSNQTPDSCIGYELTQNLDFDTDGDGVTHTSGTGDSGDDWYNSNSGWVPIGSYSNPYSGKFNGNGKIIDNLFVNRADTNRQGLFEHTSNDVSAVGLRNAYVRGRDSVATLTARNAGRIVGSGHRGRLSGDRRQAA